jgi:transposase-like protein
MSAMSERTADTPQPTCPFCESTDVTRESAFGSEISKSQYYCHGCATVFERLKYDGKRPDTGR